MQGHIHNPSLLEKLLRLIQVYGPVRSLKFLLIKSFLSLYRLTKSNKKFVLNGKDYKYFYHSLNNTWDNELCVELAVFIDEVKKTLKSSKKVLELGGILKNYYCPDTLWDIIDHTEFKDINELKKAAGYDKKYDLIFSISAFEHLGFSNDLINVDFADEVFSELIEHLSHGGKLLFSFPLGYNKYFDHKISKNKLNLTNKYYLHRKSYDEWVQEEEENVKFVEYNKPYSAGNALCFCVYVKK